MMFENLTYFSGGYQDLSDRSPSRDYSSGGQNDNFGGFGEDGRADRWKAHGFSFWVIITLSSDP